MTNITKHVWQLLKSDAAIQKDVFRGLINTRALARYLLKRYELKASLDSVISAIRRFEQDNHYPEIEAEYQNLFSDCVILTKNNVCCFTITKEGAQNMPKILTLPGLSQGYVRMAGANRTVKLLTDQGNMEEVKKVIPKQHLLDIKKDLSELDVFFNQEISKKRGVLARIANEISLHDINIEEIIISPPEFLIYVNQPDILKTYECILKLRDRVK